MTQRSEFEIEYGKLHELSTQLDRPIPSFSVIVPTYREFDGLRRTLGNIVYQSAHEVEREVLVIGDGHEPEVEKIIKLAQAAAVDDRQNVRIWYKHLTMHTGGGNIPRRVGLKDAMKDYVVFIDAGTGVTHNMFEVLAVLFLKNPEIKIANWDMVQQLDPVPFVSNSALLNSCDRSKGLPYVIPGCSVAIAREYAQKVEWPDTPASDWVYTSKLWNEVFFTDGKEDEERVSKEVALIPWVLTIAYGARSIRKWRPPMSQQQYEANGWAQGYEKPEGEVKGQDGATDREPDPNAV